MHGAASQDVPPLGRVSLSCPHSALTAKLCDSGQLSDLLWAHGMAKRLLTWGPPVALGLSAPLNHLNNVACAARRRRLCLVGPWLLRDSTIPVCHGDTGLVPQPVRRGWLTTCTSHSVDPHRGPPLAGEETDEEQGAARWLSQRGPGLPDCVTPTRRVRKLQLPRAAFWDCWFWGCPSEGQVEGVGDLEGRCYPQSLADLDASAASPRTAAPPGGSWPPRYLCPVDQLTGRGLVEGWRLAQAPWHL